MHRFEELKSSNTILEVTKYLVETYQFDTCMILILVHTYHVMYNKYPQGEVLDHALAQLGPGVDGGGGRQGVQRQSEEAIGREVEAMKEEVTSLKTQLHTLNSIRKKMRYYYNMRDKV
jgi:hypothetical protein